MISLNFRFEKLSKGSYPLGITEIHLPNDIGYSTKLKKSVNRLIKFEKKLLANSNKNRKQRKLKRKFHEIEEDASDNNAEVSEDALREFIKKSEGNLTNGNIPIKKKLKVKNEKMCNNVKSTKSSNFSSRKPNWSYEESFQRNSGTWFVERLDSDDSYVDEALSSNDKSPKQKKLHNHKVNKIRKINSKIDQNDRNETTPEFEVFPQSEWDLPPKEGEVEIFVPSNKYKNKMKKLAKGANKSVEELINDTLNGASKRYSLNIGGILDKKKQRYSLDTSIVKNPFARSIVTPKSEKKVKIDLKLNRSQEIHEHRATLRNSPAIPYDASKKPLKPLLKRNAIASPINPFYKRKLSML